MVANRDSYPWSAETPPLKEDSDMAGLTPEELVSLAPDAVALVKEIAAALKKDEDGKVRVTKEEGRRIRTLVFKLAVHVAQEAID